MDDLSMGKSLMKSLPLPLMKEITTFNFKKNDKVYFKIIVNNIILNRSTLNTKRFNL